MKHSLRIVSFSIVAILAWGFFSFEKKANRFRLPSGTVIRGHDENGERDKFEAWYEYMHKAAPGVNWRAIDEETRRTKIAARTGPQPGNQTATVETLANGNLVGEWKERGSANQSGRIWVADLDTTNGTVYCGSDGGNVWKGNMTGSSWTVLNDKFRMDIKMLRVLRDSSGARLIVAGGAHVYYSDDDGTTWQNAAGLSNLASWGGMKRATIMGDSLHTMYILVYEWDYTNWNGITSLYKSTDRGTSFSLIRSYPEPVYGDLQFFDFYVPVYGSSEVSFLQNDSVFSINSVTDSISFVATIPVPQPGNTLITGYIDSTQKILYAYIDQQLYTSPDSGNTWSGPVAVNIGPFSATSFSCSNVNPSRLYLGDIECHYSTNGGLSWNIPNVWWAYYASPDDKLHADIPSITPMFDAQGNEFLFVGTDGGLYTSFDNLQTVQNISLLGLNASQYYSVFTDKNDPNFIYAGAQDQGFQRCQLDSGGALGFEQVISGDYGHICSSDGGSTIFMNYPGFTDYYDDAHYGNSSASWTFNNTIPFWIPPMAPSTMVNNMCYLAGGNVNGSGSHIIQLYQTGSNLVPTELPYNFSSASAGGNISAIAISPIDENYWYVLTDNGKFFRSTDFGSTWAMSTVTGLGANYLYGATIYPSHTNLNVVYVGGSGYSNSPAWKSANGGQNFAAIATGIPNTHIFQLTGNYNDSLIFAATEVGPYVFVVAENKWYAMEGVGAPDQTYWSVEYIQAINTVRFATYGRGIWDFQVTSPSGIPALSVSEKINVFPNPAVNNFTVRLDAMNAGESELSIYDMQGKQVRTEKIQLMQGENTIPVSCSELPRGIFIVEIISGEKKYTRRIVLAGN
jgi:hypothetical protein